MVNGSAFQYRACRQSGHQLVDCPRSECADFGHFRRLGGSACSNPTSNFADLRREAARLQKIESEHLGVLRSQYTKARVRIWTMAEFVEAPMEPLQTIIDEIGHINHPAV